MHAITHTRRTFGRQLLLAALATTALTRCSPLGAPVPATDTAGGVVGQVADGLLLLDRAFQAVMPKLGLNGATLATVTAKIAEFSILAGSAARAVSGAMQQPLVQEALQLVPAIVTLIPGGAAAAPVIEAALIFLPKIAALAGIGVPAAAHRLARSSMTPDQAEHVLRRAVAG